MSFCYGAWHLMIKVKLLNLLVNIRQKLTNIMNGKLLTEQSLMPCLDITEIPHIIVVNLVSEMKHFTGSKMQICFLF